MSVERKARRILEQPRSFLFYFRTVESVAGHFGWEVEEAEDAILVLLINGYVESKDLDGKRMFRRI